MPPDECRRSQSAPAGRRCAATRPIRGLALRHAAAGDEGRRRTQGGSESRLSNGGEPLITSAQRQAQRNRNTIFVENGEVISVETFPGEQFVMRIRAPKCAAAAEPGTFVHVTCDDSLPMRRPLSIMRKGPDWIEILYKTFLNLPPMRTAFIVLLKK